jgi:hypothetical protein
MTAPIDLGALRAALAKASARRFETGLSSSWNAPIAALVVELEARRARDAEVEALVEVVSDLLSSHPKASTYPDGPCIEKQTRDELVAAMKPFTGAKP